MQKRIQVLSLLINVFLIFEVILLINQNRGMKTRLDELTKRPEPLKIGERVGSFKVITLDGDSTEITYNDTKKKYMLFVFSIACPICAKNLQNWNELAEISGNKNIDVIGISISKLESTKQYLSDKQVKFSVVMRADTSFDKQYKIIGVPLTFLIDKGGIVESVTIGELKQEQLTDLKNIINADKAI
ncbi:MAG: TlpA family protein disulfide reductase [Ignavibacteriales bacterium]|nr:TlpA family protein disulfide reductase [Ignavibacteriales bacterium]